MKRPRTFKSEYTWKSFGGQSAHFLRKMSTLCFFGGFLIIINGCDQTPPPPQIPENHVNLFQPIYRNMPRPRWDANASQQISFDETKIKMNQKMKNLIKNNPNVYHYLEQDIDKDGVKDWTLEGDYYYRLSENDNDIDGDGILNFMDADPFDFQIGNTDSDEDGIPDHLDFDLYFHKTKEEADFQALFYKKHKIIFYEKNDELTLEFMKRIERIFEFVYNNTLQSDGFASHIRAISSDFTENPDNTIFAVSFTGWKSLTFFQYLHSSQIKKNKLYHYEEIPHGLLDFTDAIIIHEFAHLYQRYLENTHTKEYLDQNSYFKNFDDKNHVFFNYSIDRLTDFKEKKTKSKSDESFLKDMGIISTYSLSAKREYFADSLVAYVLRVMSEKIHAHIETTEWEQVDQLIENTTKICHQNLPQESFDFFEKHLKLTKTIEYNTETDSFSIKKNHFQTVIENFSKK